MKQNIYRIASNYGPGVYFFPAIFNQATKQDSCLLLEEARAVYYWKKHVLFIISGSWWRIKHYTMHFIMLWRAIPRKLIETQHFYETGRNMRQYGMWFYFTPIDNYNLSDTPMIHNMCFTMYDCYCHRMAVIETPDVRSDHQHSQLS